MTVNLPVKVRYTLYIVLGVGSIVMAYLSTVHAIGQAELTAWSALSAFVGGLAALNTDTAE